MTVISHDLTPSATASDAKTVTYYPDDFVSETFGPFTTGTTGVLHLCDREYFVDHVTLRAGTASVVNQNLTISYVPEGSAVSQANAVPVTEAFNFSDTDGAGTDMVANKAYTIKGLEGGSNRIPAGSLMVYEVSGTPTSLATFYITVRFRSRLS